VYRAYEIDLDSAIDWSIDHKAIEARLDVVAGKFLFHDYTLVQASWLIGLIACLLRNSSDHDDKREELSRLADLPEDVILEASRVTNHLAQVETQNEEESESSMIAKRRKALLRVTWLPDWLSVLHMIIIEALNATLTGLRIFGEDLREYVGRFKSEVIRTFMH